MHPIGAQDLGVDCSAQGNTEMIGHRVEISQNSKVWAVLTGLAVLVYVLGKLSASIAAGSFQTAFLVGALFIAFYVVGRIAGDWRNGVYCFFSWLLFEDLLRKYLGNNMYVYFGKDVLVGVTYVSFLAACARRDTGLFRPAFRFSLGAFFLLGLVQVFNPLSPSIFYGLLGLKLYFYYIPLMFIGYAMLRHEDDLHRFLAMTMGLAGVIALIGIIQAIAGVDFLNPHSGADIEELSHVVRFTSTGIQVPRPTSVFVSDGRFGQYLILAFILGLGTAGYQLLRKSRGAWITFPVVAILVVAAVVSGSRGAFVLTAISALVLSAGMLWGAPNWLREGTLLVKAIRRSLVFVALALALALMIFPNVVGARWALYRETLSPESPEFEAGDRAWDYPVSELLKAFADPDWVMGHGIGTASLGSQYVTRIVGVPATDLAVENGFGTMILELGVVGPILWLMWSLSLIFAASKVVRKLKGTWAFPVAASILWFAFDLLIVATWGGIGEFENFVLNAYFWLLVGVLFRLPDLVHQPSGEVAGGPGKLQESSHKQLAPGLDRELRMLAR